MINLQVSKTANKSYIFLGNSNRIRYSIIITNLGDEVATSIKVKDILSSNASFVSGSIIVNGYKKGTYNCNCEIAIGSIAPGGNTIVSLEAEVKRPGSLQVVTNQAIVTYLDSIGIMQSVESAILTTPIINIAVCLYKTVDKYIANVGDILSYAVFIRNNSTINIDNVIFYDCLPTNLELFPGTISINGNPISVDSFNDGILIGTINANSSAVVSFQTKILYLPKNLTITNISNITFNYTITDNDIEITSSGASTSNCSTTKILNSSCGC